MSLLPETAQMLPHGVCLSWDPDLIATMVTAETLLGLSYLSVAGTLAIFAIKRRDFPYPALMALLAVVFAACGLSHFTDVVTLWVPAYAVQAGFKALVAVVSVPAAVVMWVLLPGALRLPSPASLAAANEDLRVAKEAAEHASRAKSDFLATMSHELRTPLNAVIGFAEALDMRVFGPLNDRQADYVVSIRDSGRHLLSLINDILDIAKLDAGRLDLGDETVDVREVVASCLVLVGGSAGRGGVALRADLPEALPPVRGDGLRLRQVVLNLLSNAVKFTPGGGEVVVAAGLAPDGSLALRVRDTGIGMAPEEVPRAFEMFTQIADPLSRRFAGTGIGLPLTKALVEKHGGRLEVETAPGRGTTVTVVLPAGRVGVAAPAADIPHLS